MQSLVPKPQVGSCVCLFLSFFSFFQEEKETQSLEILLSRLFLNIQVILLILCTAERSLRFHTCIYKYNI